MSKQYPPMNLNDREGGRGVAGASFKDEDIVTTILHTSAHAYLLFFTNSGKVYSSLKLIKFQQCLKNSTGNSNSEFVAVRSEEKVAAVIDTRDYETNRF